MACFYKLWHNSADAHSPCVHMHARSLKLQTTLLKTLLLAQFSLHLQTTVCLLTTRASMHAFQAATSWSNWPLWFQWKLIFACLFSKLLQLAISQSLLSLYARIAAESNCAGQSWRAMLGKQSWKKVIIATLFHMHEWLTEFCAAHFCLCFLNKKRDYNASASRLLHTRTKVPSSDANCNWVKETGQFLAMLHKVSFPWKFSSISACTIAKSVRCSERKFDRDVRIIYKSVFFTCLHAMQRTLVRATVRCKRVYACVQSRRKLKEFLMSQLFLSTCCMQL